MSLLVLVSVLAIVVALSLVTHEEETDTDDTIIGNWVEPGDPEIPDIDDYTPDAADEHDTAAIR